MISRPLRPAATRVAAVLILLPRMSGCSSVQTFVDGYPIGDRLPAEERLTNVALSSLDQAAPGHAEVAAVEVYDPDFRDSAGHHIDRITRSGGLGDDRIVVLRLADGSVRAVDVVCGVTRIGIETCEPVDMRGFGIVNNSDPP